MKNYELYFCVPEFPNVHIHIKDVVGYEVMRTSKCFIVHTRKMRTSFNIKDLDRFKKWLKTHRGRRIEP